MLLSRESKRRIETVNANARVVRLNIRKLVGGYAMEIEHSPYKSTEYVPSAVTICGWAREQSDAFAMLHEATRITCAPAWRYADRLIRPRGLSSRQHMRVIQLNGEDAAKWVHGVDDALWWAGMVGAYMDHAIPHPEALDSLLDSKGKVYQEFCANEGGNE